MNKKYGEKIIAGVRIIWREGEVVDALCLNCADKKQEVLEEVMKVIESEIENEKNAHKSKANRYWYYEDELKLIIKKMEELGK